MPIYEFVCKECGGDFEELVFGSAPDVKCPKCGSVSVGKKLSLFGMSGGDRPATSLPGGGGGGCSGCSTKKCGSCG